MGKVKNMAWDQATDFLGKVESKLQEDKTMSNKNELYINGMTNKVDTINSIIDNIDNNDLDTAKDSLNQLKEVEEKEFLKKDAEEISKKIKELEKAVYG